MGVNYFGQPDASLPTVQKPPPKPKPVQQRTFEDVTTPPPSIENPGIGAGGTTPDPQVPKTIPDVTPTTPIPPTTRGGNGWTTGAGKPGSIRPQYTGPAAPKIDQPQFGRFSFSKTPQQQQREQTLRGMVPGASSGTQEPSDLGGASLSQSGLSAAQAGSAGVQSTADVIRSMLGGNAGGQAVESGFQGINPRLAGEVDATGFSGSQGPSREEAIKSLLGPQTMGQEGVYDGGIVGDQPQPTQQGYYGPPGQGGDGKYSPGDKGDPDNPAYDGTQQTVDVGQTIAEQLGYKDTDGDGTISDYEKAQQDMNQPSTPWVDDPNEKPGKDFADLPETDKDAPQVGANAANPVGQGTNLAVDQSLADAFKTTSSTDWQNMYNTQAQAIKAGSAAQQNQMAAEMAARGLGSSGAFVQGTNEIGANTQTALNDLSVKVQTQKIDATIQQLQSLLAFKGKEMDDQTKRDTENALLQAQQQLTNLQADQQQQDQQTAAIEGVQAMAYNLEQHFGYSKDEARALMEAAITYMRDNGEDLTAENIWNYVLSKMTHGNSY